MNYIEANLVTLPNPVPVGLCETVRAAGYGLEGHNGQYYSDNASAAQTIINGFTAAQSLAFAQQIMLDALAAQWWAVVSGGHTGHQQADQRIDHAEENHIGTGFAEILHAAGQRPSQVGDVDPSHDGRRGHANRFVGVNRGDGMVGMGQHVEAPAWWRLDHGGLSSERTFARSRARHALLVRSPDEPGRSHRAKG